MGSRKNYKASVEVGSEVSIRFFFPVCVFLCLPHSSHPPCGLRSCAIFGHNCTCVVVSNGVSVVFLQQTTLLFKKKTSSRDTSGPMARIVSHKTGSGIIVHWSTTLRKWEPPGPLIDREWVFHAHAQVRRVDSVHVKAVLFKADGGRLDLCFKSSNWKS